MTSKNNQYVYILKEQVICISDDSIIRNQILGVYATNKHAESVKELYIESIKEDFDTKDITNLSGGAKMVSNGTFGHIISIEEQIVRVQK